MLLRKTYEKHNDTGRLKINKLEKMYKENTNQMKASISKLTKKKNQCV